MNNEIKEILDFKENADYKRLSCDEIKVLKDYITNLQQENERLKEQNNDLRKIYRNTYNKLFENGNDELARYFQAQIDDCPTFYVEPIIDYHKEWKDYKSRIEKAIEYIERSIKESQLIFGWNDIQRYHDNEMNDLLNILRGGNNV